MRTGKMKNLAWDLYGIKTKNPPKKLLESELKRLTEIQEKESEGQKYISSKTSGQRSYKIECLKKELEKFNIKK